MSADEPSPYLSDGHQAELDSSVISPEVRDARRYETLADTPENRDRLERLMMPRWAVRDESAYPGLLIPMYRVTGEDIGYQWKPAAPQEAPGGKHQKYASQRGGTNHLDVSPVAAARVQDASEVLWITEGVKKGDCLATLGKAVIVLTGVFNWRSQMGTLGDWEDIPLQGRTVVVCFDADARDNRLVMLAMRRLGKWLESKRVSVVRYLIIPGEVDGTAVKGVDDYFHAGGTLEELGNHAAAELPVDGVRDAAFSDAVLADTVCSEELDGRYRWAFGLGWMQWTGKVWVPANDATVTEAVRLWALGEFQRILERQRNDPNRDFRSQMEGWRSVLSKGKLTALVSLARGILEARSDQFDGDPDLLNCPNGILDLRTGTLTPHDPDKLMTKIAGADYVKGAQHPDWAQALTALPEDVLEWFRSRIGQALTGHTPPDDLVVICQGGGENGKSTIMDAISRAFGGSKQYYTQVSDRALVGNASDNHPTELMDFMGTRLSILEELPEDHKLDVNRIKKLAGTVDITARRMKQDTVTFQATHSLFINTNPKPVVIETDHGTWRRFVMVCFPYTYRKPGQPLKGPQDRAGDPNLRNRVRQDPRVLEAVLAWSVRGAQDWYDADRIMPLPPLRVEADTLEWRRESDLILAFICDRLEFDSERHIAGAELLSVFNEFLKDRNHKELSDRTFKARFGGHEQCTVNHVTYSVTRAVPGRDTVRPGVQMAVSYRAWFGVRHKHDLEEPQVNGANQDRVTAVTHPPVSPKFEPIASLTPGPVTAVTVNSRTPEFDSPFTPGPDPFAASPEPSAPPAGRSLGFDLETHSVNRLFTHRSDQDGGYVRLSGVIDEDGNEIICNSPESLLELLEGAGEIYGHNVFRFDLMALARHCGADYDALAQKTWDTYVDATVIDPPGSKGSKPWGQKGYYGLDQIAVRMGLEGKTDDLKALARQYAPGGLSGEAAVEEGFGHIPMDVLEEYFSGDLKATRGVKTGLPEPTPYRRREQRVAHIQNRMTLNGWRVDEELLAERVEQEKETRRSSLAWLNENCGVPLTKEVSRGRGKNKVTTREPHLSPLSTTVGKEALIRAFAERGAPYYPRTASGVISLSGDAMGEGSYMIGNGAAAKVVPAMLHPRAYGTNDDVREMCGHIVTVTGSVLKYEEIAKYVVDGRVHGHVGADQASGRWAMVRPSVTNLGKRGAKVEQRAPFLPEEGHVLLAFDMDQVDMRAIAGHCQDPAYMALFAPGQDAHAMIANQVFGRHDGEWRERSKRIGHGWNYGMSVNGIANSGVERELAQRFDDGMNEAYPVLCAWRMEVRKQAEAGQLLDNGFGRMMRADAGRAWTQAPALMGQGGARDIMCEGLLRLTERLPEVYPWLRGVVHDEVVLSVPVERAQEVTETVLDAFTFDFRGVAITAGAGKPGVNWARCYDKD